MKNSVLFIFFLLTFISCREDSIVTDIIVDEPIPIDTYIYEFGIFGLVIDEDGEPIAMAQVTASGEVRLADENGYFEFENILSSDDGIYIGAQKNGYVDGGDIIIPNGENTQRVEIVLIADGSSTLVTNSAGGTLDLQNGSQVIIPANSFDAQSEIRVRAHFISKERENFSLVYPSGFLGIDENDKPKFLNTIGALSVEFTDEQGDEVELKEGVKVDVRLPIPDGEWPDQIALWTLDKRTGYWIEETKADRSGGFYEASVSHFSWWCASDPTELQDVCFDIKNKSGEEVSNVEIFIFSETSKFISFGFTDGTGGYCDKVPADERLFISFLSNCSLGFQEEELVIDPSVERYEIVLEDLKEDILFNGNITRCDGSALEDGYLEIDFGYDVEVVQVENGQYSYLNYCGFDGNTTVDILAVDKSDKSSARIIVERIEGESTYSNDITLCESLEVFLTFKNLTDDRQVIFTDCKALKNPTETVIVAKDEDNLADNILLGIEGFEAGSFGTSFFGLSETSLPDMVTTTITSYQAIGGYVEGSYSGVTDSGDNIEGEFRAKRTK